MDPNACYRRWFIALLNEDRDEARDAHEDLTRWLARGGFEPDAFQDTPTARKQFATFNRETGMLG